MHAIHTINFVEFQETLLRYYEALRMYFTVNFVCIPKFQYCHLLYVLLYVTYSYYYYSFNYIFFAHTALRFCLKITGTIGAQTTYQVKNSDTFFMDIKWP